jgi:TRAP-type C4-dicarboxylate transport system permease small subunit
MAFKGMVDALDRVDRFIYRIEQVLSGAMFLAMFGLMFTYVMHRVHSREEGRLSLAVLKIATGMGMAPDPAFVHGPVSLGLNIALTFLFALLVVRTAKRSRHLPMGTSLAVAAGLTVALAGVIAVLLFALPNGLIWAPGLAMACMLWVGFLGASLATYEKKHLALEMADKIWPEATQRAVRGLAMFATGLFGVMVSALTWLSVRRHYTDWVADPATGVLESLELPRWALLTVLPLTMSMITLRFFGEAARIWAGYEAPPPAEDLA